MIRALRPTDLAQLTHLCNVALEHDHFFDALVREKTFGSPDYDPGLCLVEEGPGKVLRGFLAGTVFEWKGITRAWVRLFAVSPSCRNQGLATSLFAQFEAEALRRGAKTVRIMDVPINYFMPGVDPLYTEATLFLAKKGYTRQPAVNENLICDVWPGRWNCQPEIQELAAQGCEIRRASEEDWGHVQAFLSQDFPAWEYEARRALDNSPSTLHICFFEDECIAFSGAEGNNRGTGWFGPMGTRPAARGKGVGAILLRLCLNDIADLGHRQAVIPWVGPVGFYHRFCGAKRQRTFWTYEKSLA